MKAIVFINTQKSGSSREAIKQAEKMGYFTVLFTNRPHYIEHREEFPDIHLVQLVDIEDLDELRKAIKKLQMRALEIACIISFTDHYCHIAAQLAEEFHICKFSSEAIGIMENKIKSREIMRKSSYVPQFIKVKSTDTLDATTIESYLPAVIKCPTSTGSKDVLRIKNIKDYRQKSKLLFDKYPNESIILEEFLDGPQYLVECLVQNSNVNIIAIFEQTVTDTQRFIITGYNLVLTHDTAFHDKLKNAVTEIIQLHGMKNGSCHLEMRLVKDKWKLVEINPRISGGGMNNMIKAAFGINYVEEILKFAMGFQPNIQPKFKKHTYCQHLIIDEEGILEKVTGKNRAISSPGIEYVYIKPKKGAYLTLPLSMGNRYAYVIATGETEIEAQKNALQATSEIKFIISPQSEHENSN